MILALQYKKNNFPARNGEGMREADGEQVTNEETTAGTVEARSPTLGPISAVTSTSATTATPTRPSSAVPVAPTPTHASRRAVNPQVDVPSRIAETWA